jgi:hypothetical protein
MIPPRSSSIRLWTKAVLCGNDRPIAFLQMGESPTLIEVVSRGRRSTTRFPNRIVSSAWKVNIPLMLMTGQDHSESLLSYQGGQSGTRRLIHSQEERRRVVIDGRVMKKEDTYLIRRARA